MSFLSPSNPYEKDTNVYVSRPRKDGKHLVTFCYYSRRIRKLLTREQVRTYEDTDGYVVIFK